MALRAWLIPVCISLLALFVYTFGDLLPYTNFLKFEILQILLFVGLLASVTLPNKLRWLLCLAYSVYAFIAGYSILWTLIVLALIVPPLHIETLKAYGFQLWRYLRLLPFVMQVFVLFTTVIIAAYYPLQNSYFEGDEWIFFRLFTPLMQSKIWWIQGFITTFDTANTVLIHKTPLANMLYVIEFKIFGLQFLPYVLTSLTSHLLVSCAILLFLLEFTKNKLISVLSSLLFAVSAVHSQGVTWMMAAIHTEHAVGFGFLSLYFALKNFKSAHKFYAVASAVALLFSLWSKETAVLFIPLILYLHWMFWQSQRQKMPRQLFLYVAIGIFVVTQLFSRVQQEKIEVDPVPWTYTVAEQIQSIHPSKLLFWTGTLLLKAPAQSLFTTQTILDVGIWMTDQQFPFFNQEKAVGGTTYASFIFSPAPEFISYFFSSLVIFWIVFFAPKRYRVLKKFMYIYFLLSIMPLIANIIQFPWWGYTAFIDGRHLYHISPSIITLFVISLEGCIEKFKSLQEHKNILLVGAVAALGYFYIISVHSTIARQQKDANFADRKLIVSKLQNEITTPPKDLIIYTTSNRTYYGFANFMLPFQTAFSHMLPVIFSSEYHLNGHLYPPGFYTEDYLKGQEKGIITEGYFAADGYGLGYYLSEIPLIKLLERTGKDISSVYAFNFDGDNHDFTNTTADARKKIEELLARRKIFSNWPRHGSTAEGFSFQVAPNWTVQVDRDLHQYTVLSDKLQPIIVITAIDNADKKDFATYVINQFAKKFPLDQARYEMSHLEHDLDYPHNIYFHKTNPNEFYILSGNNEMFYKMTVTDSENAKLLIRTLEFNDTIDEDISL